MRRLWRRFRRRGQEEDGDDDDLNDPAEPEGLRYGGSLEPDQDVLTREDDRDKKEAQWRWRQHSKSLPTASPDDLGERHVERVGKKGPCESCERIATKSIFTHAGFDIGSMSGCPICIAMLERSFRLPVILFKEQAKRVECESSDHSYTKKRLVLEFFNPMTATPPILPSAVAADRGWASFVSTVTARELHSPPDDPGCYSLAASWLQTCSSTHPKCDQSGYTKPPTRLIEIVGDMVFLRQSETLSQPKPQYAALTYCWGGGTTLQMTAATIAQHEAGIPVKKLPATLRDAVLVTKRLGIDFIWIDALCILQDSQQDWEAECLRMGDYYRYSYLTISPLEATAADTGFLQQRNPILTCQAVLDGEFIGLRQPICDTVSGSPLSTRGWALQERLLATRILHYGKNEILWECLTCTAREGSTEQVHGDEDSSDLVTSEGRDFKRCLSTLGNDPHNIRNGAFSMWYRMVRLYSARSLTFDSDKLPAISAIARIISDKTGSKYLAGVFQNDMNGLAWSYGKNETRYDTQPASSPLPPARPTWSWASVDGAVRYPFHHQSPIANDKEAQYVAYHPDIGAGCLEVRALSRPVVSMEGTERTMGTIDYYSFSFDSFAGTTMILGVLEMGGVKGKSRVIGESLEPAIEDVMAIGIGERRYRSSEHLRLSRDKLCECFGVVEEIYCYVLLVRPHDTLDGYWRRIGLGVVVSAPSCQSGIRQTGFDGAEWATFRLV
ncbi:heterokaryon incompatibility protein-domain-containing protein [Immersiella caudata]|uniref:Heterokaryon incompatibility protein-domain-containing protein n=1 Tax=Immersiella caudata TaxID=314043 RepID=A0AA39U6I1_9PEZI|nr:heterokaryon incompatibility protein-domain-containing protein [Immersiella caudata]